MDSQERLRRIFCLTKDEAARFFSRMRLYEVRDLRQMPCPLQQADDPMVHLGWVDWPDPLVILRAADLPRLCVWGAQAIAGR